MGILLKIILFGLVFYYILRTVGGFLYKILGGQPRQPQTQRRQHYDTNKEGDINIDYVPNKGRKRRSSSGSREGDYIDYEEVK